MSSQATGGGQTSHDPDISGVTVLPLQATATLLRYYSLPLLQRRFGEQSRLLSIITIVNRLKDSL